jgi:hypothetical protein
MFGHAVSAQSPTPPPKPWPTAPPFNDAIDAFTKVLTQAGWDKNLRKELIASCDSAKKAVARVANMKIDDPRVIIIFYEGKVIQAPSPSATPAVAPMVDLKLLAVPPVEPRQNEFVHVFVLPPLDESDKTKTHEYKNYLMCCYQYWRTTR